MTHLVEAVFGIDIVEKKKTDVATVLSQRLKTGRRHNNFNRPRVGG
jgi:hypothetical protein